MDWFTPAEASLKRTFNNRLVFKLLQIRSGEVTSTVCCDEHLIPRFPENNENEMDAEFLSEKCNATIAQQVNLSVKEWYFLCGPGGNSFCSTLDVI